MQFFTNIQQRTAMEDPHLSAHSNYASSRDQGYSPSHKPVDPMYTSTDEQYPPEWSENSIPRNNNKSPRRQASQNSHTRSQSKHYVIESRSQIPSDRDLTNSGLKQPYPQFNQPTTPKVMSDFQTALPQGFVTPPRIIPNITRTGHDHTRAQSYSHVPHNTNRSIASPLGRGMSYGEETARGRPSHARSSTTSGPLPSIVTPLRLSPNKRHTNGRSSPGSPPKTQHANSSHPSKDPVLNVKMLNLERSTSATSSTSSRSNPPSSWKSQYDNTVQASPRSPSKTRKRLSRLGSFEPLKSAISKITSRSHSRSSSTSESRPRRSFSDMLSSPRVSNQSLGSSTHARESTASTHAIDVSSPAYQLPSSAPATPRRHASHPQQTHQEIHFYTECPHTSPPCTRPLDTQPRLQPLTSDVLKCPPYELWNDLGTLDTSKQSQSHQSEIDRAYQILNATNQGNKFNSFSTQSASLPNHQKSPTTISTIQGRCFDCDYASRRDREAEVLASHADNLASLEAQIRQLRLQLDSMDFKNKKQERELERNTSDVEQLVSEAVDARESEVKAIWLGYSRRWGPGLLGLSDDADDDDDLNADENVDGTNYSVRPSLDARSLSSTMRDSIHSHVQQHDHQSQTPSRQPSYNHSSSPVHNNLENTTRTPNNTTSTPHHHARPSIYPFQLDTATPPASQNYFNFKSSVNSNGRESAVGSFRTMVSRTSSSARSAGRRGSLDDAGEGRMRVGWVRDVGTGAGMGRVNRSNSRAASAAGTPVGGRYTNIGVGTEAGSRIASRTGSTSGLS